MGFESKYLASFLLGAAAAFGVYKYATMSDEEKEKMMAKIKEKASQLKDHAIEVDEKAMDYINELKEKGSEMLKEYMPKVEEYFDHLFRQESPERDTAPGA